jgi:hypothetical protein
MVPVLGDFAHAQMRIRLCPLFRNKDRPAFRITKARETTERCKRRGKEEGRGGGGKGEANIHANDAVVSFGVCVYVCVRVYVCGKSRNKANQKKVAHISAV